ncbi:MAG: diaminopimelate decarboxylase [Caulobacterales bacterium]
MDHFVDKGGVLHCEDVSLEDIAARVGTPAYVYSTATLERHVQVFRDALAPRDVLIAFAVKANSNIAVLATLARAGAGMDTVSAGEIKRALKAGATPDKIIFSGVGKTEDELAFAIETGIHQINVESSAELGMLEDVAARLNARPGIAIRVNPNIGAGGHAKIATGKSEDKFGVSLEEAMQLYARAAAHKHLDIKGLAIHIGSQIKDLGPLEAAFTKLRKLAETLRRQGLPLTQLDLGGGLGVPYFHEAEPPSPAEYGAMVKRVFEGMDVKLAFEPGRLISGNAGVLLTRVIRMQERPERRMLVVDAAMNDLIRPAMYEAYHDMKPVRAPAANAPRKPFDIVGPICETGDTFAKDRALTPLAPGDLVAFLTAGAYGAVMSSTYNSRTLVPEVLVRGGKFEIVRRPFDIDAQMALEKIPDWA